MLPAMLGRAATTVLPTLTVVVTALVLLGPGKPRAATGARVWGAPAPEARSAAPAEGGARLALRIEGVRRHYGVDDAAAGLQMTLEVRAADEIAGAWTGTTGPDGIAEALVSLARPQAGPLSIRIADGERVFAEGPIAPGPRGLPAARPTAIGGTERGDMAVRVEAARGIMASPFEEEIRVSAGKLGGEASVEVVSAFGAEVQPERAAFGEGGRAALRVKALAHNVELSLKVKDGAGKEGAWEGYLPIVPGAMWLDPQGLPGELRIASPAPRERAYVSLFSEEGRVFGAVVPLSKAASGFHAGSVPLPEPLRSAKALQVVIAGDPYEQGAGTAAWPIAPPEGKASPPRVALLLDGVPRAEAREMERASGARRVGVMLVGAAAIAEVLLLVLRSRAAQRKLEAHFAGAAESAGERERLLGAAREHPLLGALVGAALIGLAFALIMALATLRGL
jgi:hypothetical protein